MQTESGTLIGQRSTRLVYRWWAPDEPPRALAVVVHGIGEHKGRYRHVVEALVSGGYAVYMLDHRGHGASAGERANVERFDYFVEDLHLLVTLAREAHADLPVFMVGHSMGSLIALRYALLHQRSLAGLVVTGVALQVGDDASPLLKRLAPLIVAIAPRLPVAPMAKGDNLLSRDLAVQAAIDSDPLCYKGKVKARISYEILKAAAATRARLADITLPLLIMHGTDDRITNPRGAQDLLDAVGSADKTLRLWPECRHEIYNELCKDEVLTLLLDWLDERAVPRPAMASAATQ